MNKVIKHLMLASGLIVAGVGNATAGLERVGPNDTQNGYPLWYQDTQGLALDLCRTLFGMQRSSARPCVS